MPRFIEGHRTEIAQVIAALIFVVVGMGVGYGLWHRSERDMWHDALRAGWTFDCGVMSRTAWKNNFEPGPANADPNAGATMLVHVTPTREAARQRRCTGG